MLDIYIGPERRVGVPTDPHTLCMNFHLAHKFDSPCRMKKTLLGMSLPIIANKGKLKCWDRELALACPGTRVI